jgi:hypothetical protein
MPNGPLLTTRETAARLGVSRSTIHRLVLDKTLVPAQTIQVGANGAHLFDPDVIDALAAERSTVSVA